MVCGQNSSLSAAVGRSFSFRPCKIRDFFVLVLAANCFLKFFCYAESKSVCGARSHGWGPAAGCCHRMCQLGAGKMWILVCCQALLPRTRGFCSSPLSCLKCRAWAAVERTRLRQRTKGDFAVADKDDCGSSWCPLCSLLTCSCRKGVGYK